MRTISLIILLGCTSPLLAQDNCLNRLDSEENPHGTWVVFWNNAWQVTDSSKAVYCWYTHFDHGQNLRPMAPRSNKWKMVATDSSHSVNGRVLLDGEYRWYDESGNLRSVDVFSKGEYVSYKCYHPNGQLLQWFDYTRTWEGQPHSWYIAEYHKNGQLKREGYFKRDRNRQWPVAQ